MPITTRCGLSFDLMGQGLPGSKAKRLQTLHVDHLALHCPETCNLERGCCISWQLPVAVAYSNSLASQDLQIWDAHRSHEEILLGSSPAFGTPSEMGYIITDCKQKEKQRPYIEYIETIGHQYSNGPMEFLRRFPARRRQHTWSEVPRKNIGASSGWVILVGPYQIEGLQFVGP